ncbi:hypothetical protein, partial [Rhodopirellula sp. MGV]|uniref:hypothetical protein n=1 Tax=Rhodopirellula sp. MGV TaxID=2023130 RepID=UPI001E602E8D
SSAANGKLSSWGHREPFDERELRCHYCLQSTHLAATPVSMSFCHYRKRNPNESRLIALP